MLGRRQQDGRLRLRQELAKLAFSEGREWAQDDVSGVELDPDLVRKAREVEMTFVPQDAGVHPSAPSDAEGEGWEDHRVALGGGEQGRL